MSSLLQAEDLLYKKYPAFSVHFDEYFGVFFLQHLLKIRMIPSPVKQKQTKQIHSHLKKVHVSRFPVVSNEAIQDLNSVAVNKHT